MEKRKKFSPFEALKQARTSKQPTVETARQPASQTTTQLAKSKDEEFLKFTTYVRKRTHRAVKTRLVGEGREMSDLVEELLTHWLESHNEDMIGK